jgi:hypothetical protein
MPQLRFSFGAWIVGLVPTSIVAWCVWFGLTLGGAPAPCVLIAMTVAVLVAPCLLLYLAAEACPDESLLLCFAYSAVPLLVGFTTLFSFRSLGLIWSIAGVATFGMCLFGRFLGRRAAQRRPEWRLLHGLCPACAYPVGSNLCTECGKAIPSSLRRRATCAGSDSAPNDAPIHPPLTPPSEGGGSGGPCDTMCDGERATWSQCRGGHQANC